MTFTNGRGTDRVLASRRARVGPARRTVALGQGAYYIATGLWPILSMRSFEAVTGRKRDRWLVRVVGLLALAWGGLLVREARRPRPDPAAGMASASAFGAASLWYWGRGRINHAYLLDALAEAAMLGAWLGLGGVRLDGRAAPTRRTSGRRRPIPPVL